MTGQGITVAISQAGITAFCRGLLAPKGSITKAIDGVTLADYPISVTNPIDVNTGQDTQNVCTNINIDLSQGSISSYTPSFTSVQQQTRDTQNPAGGVFQLAFSSSGNFNANYSWVESYTAQSQYYNQNNNDPTDPGNWTNQGAPFPVNTPFAYSPSIGSLNTTTDFTFKFDSTNNTWDLPVTSVTATSTVASANIPSGSVLQNQDQPGCVASHVDAATQKSITNGIDFQSAMQTAVGSNLATISASGNLTPDIVFAFGLGDSPLTFPNDQGLTVGVTGVTTYKGQTYAGTLPTTLPVPSVPTDGHHLQMYVSNYVFNGLYWAFALDGKLTSTVQPTDLNDPAMLDVQTYYNGSPATSKMHKDLAPYRMKAMSATVAPQVKGTTIQPPTVAFQTVYVFNKTTLATLQNVLPADVYSSLSTSGIGSNAYTNTTDLESDLGAIPIDSSYFTKIENTISILGALVTHNLVFTLTILGATIPNSTDAPTLTFTMTRQDILTNLQLGIATATGLAKPAQSLQFTHTECQPPPTVTLTASNFMDVTDDDGTFDTVWSQVGENEYATLLATLGTHGVALPIMEGFQFVFDQALLNVEQGYIGILSDVEFTG